MAYEPLSGTEVKECVLRNLRALLDQHSDLSAIYAYPRVSWRVAIVITPYYTDEKPIAVQTSGELGTPIGKLGESKELAFEQQMVTDPDSLRPEMQQEPRTPEEESEKPGPLNPMVRIGN
jgi:hypothetical protein